VEGRPAARTTLAAAFQRLSLGAIPGFAAGFTRGPLAAASLGPEAAARALATALGAPDAEVVRLNQVHGACVLTFEEPPRKRRDSLLGEGDGLLTSQPNVFLAVASADCVPIVLADPGTGWIAAVHAGWRGTAARVLDAALDALAARGVRLGNLFAAFGPSISRDRYEVGPEVVAALLEAYGVAPEGAIAPGADGKAFLDVAAFNEAALRARGVRPERIAACGLCTTGTPDLPSWRRDGADAGRILTGIVRR
jgi:polyphenol oxidase